MTPLESGLALARELQRPQPLESLLERLVERVASVCQTRHAALRLLDARRERLQLGWRRGTPLHQDALFEFSVGEGLVGWVVQSGQVLRTGNAEADPRFLARPDVREPFSSFLGIPLISEGMTFGVLSLSHPLVDHFTEEHERWATLMVALGSGPVEQARRARLQLVEPASARLSPQGLEVSLLVDPLPASGLFSLLVVDIDDPAGAGAAPELVLRAVGQTLAASLEIGEAVVRSGRSEFLVTLPGSSLAAAARTAERARRQLADTPLEPGVGPARVSVSIGVAERQGDEPRSSLLARTRVALQAARARGGNCVQLAQPPDPAGTDGGRPRAVRPVPDDPLAPA